MNGATAAAETSSSLAGSDELAEQVVARATAAGVRVAVAESLTGGLLCASLVSVPGASRVVAGGVVAYASELKHTVLCVDAELLQHAGPVDAEVAQQMARGVRARCSLQGEHAKQSHEEQAAQTEAGAVCNPIGTVSAGTSEVSAGTSEVSAGRDNRSGTTATPLAHPDTALSPQLGVATTGVAGPDPDPQTGQLPGTVYIGVSSQFGERNVKLRLSGGRESIREQTVRAALAELLEEIDAVSR